MAWVCVMIKEYLHREGLYLIVCDYCGHEFKYPNAHKKICFGCNDESENRRRARAHASAVLKLAVDRDKVAKPTECELCGSDYYIVGHHWNGYDDPLNVWWICQKCNRALSGPKYHTGTVSKAEAREVIRND